MREKMEALFEEFKGKFFSLVPAPTNASPVLGGKYVDVQTGDLYTLAKATEKNGAFGLSLSNFRTGLRRHKSVFVANPDSITASEWSAITGPGNLVKVNL